MKTTESILAEVKKSGVISEANLKLLTRRKNAKEKFDEGIFWDGEVFLTKDQEKKALKWLMNLYKSPTGKERANNPFGYREQLILETFERIRFKGWYDAGSMFSSFNVPLYEVHGENNTMEYYVSGGKINLVG